MALFFSPCLFSSIQLKLAINRLRLHRTKKLEEGNRHKKEIAELLKTDKEQLARVKVGHPLFTGGVSRV